IFGGLTASSHSALAEGCGATRSCTPADVAETNTFARVSDVSLGVTLAGAVVGSVLLAVGLSASGGSEQRATLTPWITPEGACAVEQLRFCDGDDAEHAARLSTPRRHIRQRLHLPFPHRRQPRRRRRPAAKWLRFPEGRGHT